MVQSTAETVAAYLAELEAPRREVISALRQLVLNNLPSGYRESVNWGMIAYEVPLSVLPKTYNNKPLLYCSLAAQKRHNAIYLMNLYCACRLEEALVRGFSDAGKKLDMGKCCVRFKTLDDLPLEVIAGSVAATPMERFIENYHSGRGRGAG